MSKIFVSNIKLISGLIIEDPNSFKTLFNNLSNLGQSKLPKVSNILFEQLQPGQWEREELDEEESGCLNQNQGQNLNKARR